MKIALAAIAAPIALVCSPAVAQDVPPPGFNILVFDGSDFISRISPDQGTTANFTFEFSEPVSNLYVYAIYEVAYSFESDIDSTGDVFLDSEFAFSQAASSTLAQFTLNFPRGGRFYGEDIFGNGRGIGRGSFSYVGGSFGLNFDSDSPRVGLRITSAYVPEPATWAMLILGFGAIGAAMRSRRKVSVSYA